MASCPVIMHVARLLQIVLTSCPVDHAMHAATDNDDIMSSSSCMLLQTVMTSCPVDHVATDSDGVMSSRSCMLLRVNIHVT